MKAVVLLSGGIDSTTALAIAINRGRECAAVCFDYGQRHRIELESAARIAAHYGIPHQVIAIDPSPFAGSSLLSGEPIEKGRTAGEIASGVIPSTYVPARNLLFLSYATAWAERMEAGEIYIGANADDRHGYPDCRPGFFSAYQQVINAATQQALEKTPPNIVTPLSHLSKEEVIAEGMKLQAPLDLTFSCYDPVDGHFPCRRCDACTLRKPYDELAAKSFPHAE